MNRLRVLGDTVERVFRLKIPTGIFVFIVAAMPVQTLKKDAVARSRKALGCIGAIQTKFVGMPSGFQTIFCGKDGKVAL